VSGEAIVCRPATPADAAALAELFHLCDRHYWGDKAAPLEEIAVHVRDNVLSADADARVLLAEVSGKAVGFACFALFYPAPDCGGQIYMKELFVREEARGGGAGIMLMRAVARAGLSRGAVRLDWTAEETNPRALAYYDHLGARRLEEKVYFRFDGATLKDFAEGE
jgi:GNAT superfamily N-acetyltransferase